MRGYRKLVIRRQSYRRLGNIKKSKNVKQTFKQYLVLAAVSTNKSTYGMMARTVLEEFKCRDPDKMRAEDVDEDARYQMEELRTLWMKSHSFERIDPCAASGWNLMQEGCHIARVHLGV